MAERLACPTCTAPVDRLQRSYGVVATYPCGCWLHEDIAHRAAREWRERKPAA